MNSSRQFGAFQKRYFCYCLNTLQFPFTYRVNMVGKPGRLARSLLVTVYTQLQFAEGAGLGAEGEVCILRSLGIAASFISLLSMGGV